MIDGDVPPGDYVIKINTVDETEEDFSNVFTITLPQGSSMFLAGEDDNVSTSGMFGLNKSFWKSRKHTARAPIKPLRGSSNRFLAAGGKFERELSSEKNNKIGYNNDMPFSYGYSMYDRDKHGPNIGFNSSNSTYQVPVTSHQSQINNQQPIPSNKTLSTTLVDTYYIWSHDGKLMAEYDHNGGK